MKRRWVGANFLIRKVRDFPAGSAHMHDAGSGVHKVIAELPGIRVKTSSPGRTRPLGEAQNLISTFSLSFATLQQACKCNKCVGPVGPT